MDVLAQGQTQPLSTLSAFSYIPPRRREPKELSYFQSEPKAPEVSTYDQLFHQALGYDENIPRDDRRHYKGRGLDIHKEEMSRSVPLRTSSEYGRRPALPSYPSDRQHARVARVQADFFMKNGVTWNLAAEG
ncbi:cilia- and flagella-associated protein 90 [Neosynchiropus ocellatus]